MITVVGIGPGGTQAYLYDQAKQAMDRAVMIIGSERQLQIVPQKKRAVCQRLPRKLTELACILQHHLEQDVVLLASGDPLMYGIAHWVMQHFSAEEITILPGISSIHYFFHTLKIPMEDCFITSSHGKQPDFELLFKLPKVAMVTDQQTGPYQLAQAARKQGKNPTIYVGENLSYPNEKISCYLASELPDSNYQMNVVVIINEG